jgi:hypothetical protein
MPAARPKSGAKRRPSASKGAPKRPNGKRKK